MPLIEWNASFSVQVEVFDNQHKKLIDIINRLNDAMKAGKGKDALDSIFAELAAYTADHFAAEEKLMGETGFPALIPHRSEHQKLIAKVKDLQTKATAGQVMITLEVMNFLKDWLQSHILGVDKKYGQHLNANGYY